MNLEYCTSKILGNAFSVITVYDPFKRHYFKHGTSESFVFKPNSTFSHKMALCDCTAICKGLKIK